MRSTTKTDAQARLTLPEDFASCLVVVERDGDEIRVRKVSKLPASPYTFKQLMAGVTKDNIPAAIDEGPLVGKELL